MLLKEVASSVDVGVAIENVSVSLVAAVRLNASEVESSVTVMVERMTRVEIELGARANGTVAVGRTVAVPEVFVLDSVEPASRDVVGCKAVEEFVVELDSERSAPPITAELEYSRPDTLLVLESAVCTTDKLEMLDVLGRLEESRTRDEDCETVDRVDLTD